MIARFVLLMAAALTILSAARVAERPQAETPKKPCCFRNPGYTGTCKVQPAEDETCATILAYLNNPMAEGKTYCGSTTVRQGWTEVPCEDEGPDAAR